MENIPEFSPAAVICLTLLIVVAVNGGLILAMRRGGSHRQVDMLRRAAKAARNPWTQQEEEMSELRERVSQLEPEEADPSKTDG
jgi:hypothetical protein